MKYWKPRAAAIVVLVAALLIGGVGGANQEGEGLRVSAPLIPGESTVATALNRLITTLAGVERAEDPAAPEAQEPPAATEAPAATPAPGEASVRPGTTTAGPGATTPAPGAATPAPAGTQGAGSVAIGIGGGEGPVTPAQTRLDDVAPSQRIPRNYHVDNEGSTDAYVFLSVTLPYVVIATQKDDGTYVSIAAQPLYTFDVKPGWRKLGESVRDERITYVYAYASSLGRGGMTPLGPGRSTGALFDELVTANYVEGSLDGTEKEVVARAYAIQTQELGDADTAAAIWKLVRKNKKGNS